MKTYFVGIHRTWETSNGFEEDRRDFEIQVSSRKEAFAKAAQIAEEHGKKWSVSYAEEA